MPVVRIQPRDRRVELVREARDSAGRDDKTARGMDKNTLPAPLLHYEDNLYAEQIATEYVNYPKVMYGKPDLEAEPPRKPDRINPDYPMPYDLAIEAGYTGQVKGHGSDKSIDVVHPYATCWCPIGWDPKLPVAIDEASCKKDEAELIKQGWVDHPRKLKTVKSVTKTD